MRLDGRLAQAMTCVSLCLALPVGRAKAQHTEAPASSLSVVRLRDGGNAFLSFTGISDSLETVVRDSSTWQQLWERINQPFIPRPPAPHIDFSREMVVVAALGARPSGGYDVVIEGIERDSAGVEVVVRRVSPSQGCPVEAVVTQPVDLAKIPATARPVHFRDHAVVVPCGTP